MVTCSVCCQRYVLIVNIGVLLFGLGLLGFALGLLLADPVRQGQNGGEIAQEFLGNLWSIGLIMIGMLVAGIVVSVAGIIGLRFACTKNRRTGGVYVLLLLLALGLQVAMAVGLFAQSSQIAFASDLTREYIGRPINETAFNDRVDANQRRVMSEGLDVFMNTFEKNNCSFGPATPAAAEAGGAALASVVLAESWQESPERALATSSPEERCVPGRREIQCEEKSDVGNFMTSYCYARSRGNQEFSNQCQGCVVGYLVAWNVTTTLKLTGDKLDTFVAGFEGEKGTAFCRCLTAFFMDAARHATTIIVFAIIFIVLETCLLLSVCGLLVCGPDQPEDESNMVELGHRY